jgi:hypothetical protein
MPVCVGTIGRAVNGSALDDDGWLSHRLGVKDQLSLFAPIAAAASSTAVAEHEAPAPTVATPALAGAPAVSRTRLLVEAVTKRLPGARVVIVDTRSVLLSQSVKDGVRTVRVHQMFLDADDAVRLAVGMYLSTGHRGAGEVIDAFTKRQTHLLEWAARPLKHNAGRGKAHDLDTMFAALNARYFADAIGAEVTWGQAGPTSRRRRRSITFGSYDHRARRITMHPVLDRVEVPALVVARVLHHEMLHEKHGEDHDAGGRRIVHSAAFRAEETTFDGADVADAWLDAHLDALLRWRP